MHPYLQDTEYATRNLLALAKDEEQRLAELFERLRSKEAEVKAHDWDFRTSDMNDDFSDAYVMAAFSRRGRAHQEAQVLHQSAAALQASVGSHQHAVQAIAGAVLQIAKQGVSLVHGQDALKLAPTGRNIGSLALRDIIWQARNQSMHYEEGNLNKWVVGLFATLEAEHGASFSLTVHAKQNRAKQVVDLLGWSDYAAFSKDMQTLMP